MADADGTVDQEAISSIYFVETTHKKDENLLDNEEASMPYPLESKHPPAALTPAEDIRDENDNSEPGLPLYKPPEPPTEQEIEETLKPAEDDDENKVAKFVKWFTSDQKKDAVKKPEKAIITAEASALPEPATQAKLVTNPVTLRKNSVTTPQHDGLERIPPLSVPVKELPSGIITIPGIIQPENAVTTKVRIPESQSMVPAVQEQQQSSRKDPVPEIASVEAEPDPAPYLPQSPPTVKEVTETLGPQNKKEGKGANKMVKWLFADPKKKAAKAAPEKSPDPVKASNGAASQKAAGKLAPLSNILGGISKQKKSDSDDLPDFSVNELGRPGLDGPVTGVNVTYAVSPPFQYINILFDGEELVYNIQEPPLGEGQKKRLEIIERSLEKLISSKIVAIKAEEREQFLRDKFEDIVRMYNWTLTEEYKDRMFFYLRKKYLGYDRIEILMKDHYIEDISCNGPNTYLYIYHRIYGSIRSNISFDDVTLNKFVMRMAQISGRHISILQPIKDISLPDGSRANLTLGTEVTKKGATFTIRKFKERPISPIELMDYKSIDSRALAFLWTLLDYKRSILVSGGTASGKTTLMNVLCSFIKPEMKIVSLEDTPELNLAHPNWIQSVTRSGFGAESGGGSASGVSGLSAPGKSPGDIGLYDLLVAALRQRPEYILVGEVRGAEAFTLFQAIAVGHAAMGTIHAGTMRELLSRVESNPMNVPRTLFASMDAVCFSALVRRGDHNVRRVLQIVEILELDTDGNLVTNPVFKWDAFSDKFVFSGKSHIFEKIEGQLGITQEAILKEMDNRSKFLLDLRSQGIKDYYEVVERVREYELNKLTGSNQN